MQNRAEQNAKRRKKTHQISTKRSADVLIAEGVPNAEHIRVQIDKTKTEIEQTLTRYGADRFAYFTESGKAIIVFEAHGRRLRFDLPLPAGNRDREQKIRRQKWRALLLCIKAKLESVASKIERFEEAFLAHVVMPDGGTVYQHTQAQISNVYEAGEVRPLLPPPGGV